MSSDPVLAALDALAVELGIGANGLAFTWDQLEAMNGVLHAHAHELAEKIRARFGDLYGSPDSPGPGRDYGLLDAADLIDPEVTS